MDGISYEDLIKRSSEILNHYNNIGIPGRYINKISYVPFPQMYNIVMKLDISLTNIAADGDTTYTYWISNKGSIFCPQKDFAQLTKIITEWLKTIRQEVLKPKKESKLIDCGVLYSRSALPVF
jgi:hypothetical protein